MNILYVSFLKVLLNLKFYWLWQLSTKKIIVQALKWQLSRSHSTHIGIKPYLCAAF